MKHSVFRRGIRHVALVAALMGFAQATIAQSTLSSLMYFNGSTSAGAVTLGSDGALYGVASESTLGGGAIAGLLYRVTTNASEVSTLYQYGRLGAYEGAGPRDALTAAPGGVFYGVTAYSAIDSFYGVRVGNGTIFKVTQGGTYTRLYSFPNYTTTTAPFVNTEGAAPNAALLLATDGLLYGSAVVGGANGNGTLFKVATDGTGFQVLHTFAATTAANPDSLAADPKSITTDGAFPQVRLIQGTNGDLFGTTFSGGPNGTGVIFAMQRDGGNFRILRVFDASPDTITDANDPNYGKPKVNASGAYPKSSLLLANNGFLYGTTSALGPSGFGTIYRIAQDGTGFTVLKSFDGSTDGGVPTGDLIVAQDGTLVGTTNLGGIVNGTAALGTLYSMSLDGTTFTDLYTFATEGGSPRSGVIQTSDGSFYGTTTTGSPYNLGTVFKFGTATNATPQGTPQPFDSGGALSLMLIAILGLLAIASKAAKRFAR